MTPNRLFHRPAYFAHFFLLILLLCSGCNALRRPQSLGELESGFTYVPIDPVSVRIVDNTTNAIPWKDITSSNLLSSLPDNAVRIAIENIDANGNVSYGPASATSKSYKQRVTLDFINADTINVKLYIKKSIEVPQWEVRRTNLFGRQVAVANTNQRIFVKVTQPLPKDFIPGSEWYTASTTPFKEDSLTRSGGVSNAEASQKTIDELSSTKVSEVNIPVYVGIGLRVVADISSMEGKVDLSGLAAIAAAAEAKRVHGSLVVQSLGINGKSIAAALPIQSELNQTTTQNAVVSVGAMKAIIYDRETVVIPRIVGLYLPFAGGKPLVNAIITALSEQPQDWQPVALASPGAPAGNPNPNGVVRPPPPAN